MANPRNVALNVLLKIEQEQAYSNLALSNAIRESRLSGVDSAFVSALVYGLRKIETKTKLILRMGVYQLLFMDKVPDSAAVNESVNLAKKHRLQKSSGFINGILRSISRAEVRFRLPDDKDKIYYYSIKYSAPQDLVRLWINSYGELNAVAILESLSGRPPICARVNTTAEKIAFLPGALYLSNTGAIENLRAFRDGLFHIQDASSQLCVSFLDPKPRELMLDVCAAPGGKSFTAAELMNDRGKVLAFDLYDHKVRLMESGAKRLGLGSVRASVRDAAVGMPLPVADRILCDVPCSGLGILSRKPEIRCKDGLLTADLPQLQYKILERSAEYLASGGRLVYSTCTLNPRENNEIAARFLSEHPDFEGVPLTLPDGVERAFDEQAYEITLMPHKAHTDGFYCAAFTRRSR